MLEPNSMSAVEAMNLSQREDRIVHLSFSKVLESDLFPDCDGHATDGPIHEYWGPGWRIHLHQAKPRQDGLVLVERMPAHLRESHKAARNWGQYPHNGAKRVLMATGAAEYTEDDEYDHIIRAAKPGDEDQYPVES